MQKLLEFLNTHKYAIIWTACYIFIMWAILYFLFKFNMFNGAQWHRLIHAQLRGFPGFVFGILILAALPLYVATTILIIRTQKPLITITFPKIKTLEFLKRTTPAPAEPVTLVQSETPTLPPDDIGMPTNLPTEIPAELRNAFIRARNNISNTQTSALNNMHVTPPTTPTNTPESSNDMLPLPTDFDIEIPDVTAPDFSDVPTFTDISFDSDDVPDITPNSPEFTHSNSELIEYLTNANRPFSIADNIVITDTHAIATHSDPDFWVTDSENWFAAGRVCPSPITAAQNAAEKHNRTPAIYLASTNILDIDKLIPEWQSNGITVITDLSEI